MANEHFPNPTEAGRFRVRRSRQVVPSVCLAMMLAACAGTHEPQAGSLEAIKRSQFMPLFEQCMRENAPLGPGRRSAAMLHETGKACMRWAKRAVR